MTIARALQIPVMKIFVNVDQMQNVLGGQIIVHQGIAHAVRMMNATKTNIVTWEIAKVCQF